MWRVLGTLLGYFALFVLSLDLFWSGETWSLRLF